MSQFNSFVDALQAGGVNVKRFSSREGCPDAVWPNNWVVTFNEGNSKLLMANNILCRIRFLI